jgi:excisionase family DNA binding protein
MLELQALRDEIVREASASLLEPKFYSIKEACSLLGLSRATVYLRINDGSLRVVRPGGKRRVLIPATEVDRWMRGDAL